MKKSQKILDHMGSTELAANLFRATQTEEKLRRDKVHGKQQANQTHFEVGKKVRQTIEELGGTMPEHCRRRRTASSRSRARRRSWGRKNESTSRLDKHGPSSHCRS